MNLYDIPQEDRYPSVILATNLDRLNVDLVESHAKHLQDKNINSFTFVRKMDDNGTLWFKHNLIWSNKHQKVVPTISQLIVRKDLSLNFL